MPDSDPSKTMRIDIHPDFLGESLERKKKSAAGSGSSDTTVFFNKREDSKWVLSKEFEKLLQSIYDAVFITDKKGRIIRSNSRAEVFFLMDEDEMFGRRIIDLILGADDTLLTAIDKNSIEHRYTLIEAHCVRKDQSLFAAEIAVNQIELEGETCLGFFLRDVTVRKKTQEALEEAVARLEEHDRSRSQFVSNVSHELRTPLTSMIYAVSNMLRGVMGPIPDGVKRYLQMLDGDCKRLLGTVNDILDLRKIETKTLTLTKTRMPFTRLVRRSIETLKAHASQKSIEMELHGSDVTWFTDCDINKIERVMLNIVGNAVKFTPEGGTIDIYLSEDPDDNSKFLLSVLDSGIGIPTEALDKVTQRYFTVGEQATGTGLGLAISKEIVEMHGGTIKLASPPPGRSNGTGVYISLPVVQAPSILVVDDEPGVRAVLESQISAQGYKVISAGEGKEALEKVYAEKPDLMVLDFILPGMEGTEIILKLKSDKATMRIPIIVVTGADIGKARAQILNSFSIPALAKPWHEHELLDKIEGAFLGASTLNR